MSALAPQRAPATWTVVLGSTAGGEDMRGGRPYPWPQSLTTRSRNTHAAQPFPRHTDGVPSVCRPVLGLRCHHEQDRQGAYPEFRVPWQVWMKPTLENDKSLRARSCGVEMKLGDLGEGLGAGL